MKGLVESVVHDIKDADIVEHREGPVMVTDFELPRPDPQSEDGAELLRTPLYDALRAAAQGRNVAVKSVARMLGWRHQRHRDDEAS